MVGPGAAADAGNVRAKGMDRRRWQAIEEAFHRAIDLPENEKRHFLAALKAADRETHTEVESLLGQDAADDEPVFDTVEQALQRVAFEGTEQQMFGPYKAGRWLGGGSQSDVYLAERTDGEYRSKVAIKVAKRGFPTEDLRRRFRQERQILANLRHANIARVLDGGTTDEGLPFFVMEYVDGQPIDSYCDQRRLSIPERLRLFLAVCSAVEHAHRNLIIHRDLKPGNILVAEDGRPILLDFGIAKLLEEPTHVNVAVRTVEGLRFLTPAYASPEQVLGEPLTTATDVYSLGIILYALLCGRPPYELDGLEPKVLYETICERRPSAPSRSLGRSEGAGRDSSLAEERVGDGHWTAETPPGRPRHDRAHGPAQGTGASLRLGGGSGGRRRALFASSADPGSQGGLRLPFLEARPPPPLQRRGDRRFAAGGDRWGFLDDACHLGRPGAAGSGADQPGGG